MTSHVIVPQLVVTNDMYETAAEGIQSYAPTQGPLTWERFTTPDNWCLIPDTAGELSKAEMTLTVSEEHTVKLNVWFRPDVRGGEKVVPHNHRWESFTGHVLSGGYDDDHYWLAGDGSVDAELGVTHASPAANTIDHDLFHEVTRIHEPGATISLMVCGYGRFGDWCHLDIDTGKHIREQPVDGFNDMLAKLNPHRSF